MFFGLVLVRYAIHPPLLLSLLPTCQKYCIIPKCYRIIRPHLQRNHQVPMHQTLSLMLIYFFQSTFHETPTTYSKKNQYFAKLSHIGVYKSCSEVPKDMNNKHTSNMDEKPHTNDRHQEI